MADRLLKSITFPDLANKYIIADDSLSVSGAGADSKTVGDKLKEASAGIENLVTASSVQTLENKVPYLFRQTPNAGHNELDTIVGGTVAWNQFLSNGDFASTTDWVSRGANVSVANNVATVTLTGGAWNNELLQYTHIANGHAILYFADVKASAGLVGVSIYCGNSTGSQVGGLFPLTASFQRISGIAKIDSTDFYRLTIASSGASLSGESYQVKNFQAFDLTQMFGSTVADYIYSLEQATAGAGVAYFKSLGFNKTYYPYNEGELMSVGGLQSHDTVGFNAWDEVWERGAYDADDGSPYDANQIRSKNYIPVLSDTNYYIKSSLYVWMMFFDENKNILTADLPNTGASAGNARGVGDATFKTPIGCAYIRFYCQVGYGTTYKNDICINLSWSGWRNGEYEPYEKHSYELDSALTLRGIPKLDSQNNLYYDGDEYKSDGTVTRRYGIVDLGTLDWNYMSTSGSERFYSINISGTIKPPIDNNAVANIISPNYVAVSMNTIANGSADKVIACAYNGFVAVRDTAYTDASAFKSAMSGIYLVCELATPTEETAEPYNEVQICDDFGTEEYVTTGIVPVGHDTKYPMTLSDIMPTASGNYVLKCTVTGGVATYEWVSES